MLQSAKFIRNREGIGVPGEQARRRIGATKFRSAIAILPSHTVSGYAGVTFGVLAMSLDGERWQFRTDAWILGWALLTMAVLVVGVVLALRFNRTEPDDDEAGRWVWVFVLSRGCAGLCWGSSAWMMLPARSFEQDAFLFAGISMVLMGGVGAQAIHRPTALAFGVALSVAFATGLLRLGDQFHTLLGLAFVVYTAVVVLFARNQESAVTMAIELALRNEELLADRTAQQQDAQLARSVAEEARRQAESAREQAEAARELAETADRSKTSFIAATSHDLRQPMHALVQYVEHLRRSCADPGSGPTIDRIEESVGAMEQLLNAVLDFSKIAMGAVQPEPRAFPVDRLMRGLDTQIRPLAEAKALELRVESADAWCESDPVLVERVIRNIAQNAVRYTERGSIVLRASAHESCVRVLVADSGIGVPAGEHERIFDDYYQVDNRARDRRKGLGLGLSIVRDLARLLGLRIRMRSAPGRGSTFAVEIPRVAGLSGANAAADGAAAPTALASERDMPQTTDVDFVRGAFVVLIDDDPLALDALALTLRDFGCRVLAAKSASEAVQALAEVEFPPQVVVSDYRLGNDEDGLQAIAALREQHRAWYGDGFPLPALLVSGDTSPAELARVVAAGHPLLHKPVDGRRLHAAINALLCGSAASRDAFQTDA